MGSKRIIPCLDVCDGRVVKGVNFVGLHDAGDPISVAKRYNEQKADEIILLDITASKYGRMTTIKMVNKIACNVFIPLTVGGGIRSCEDIRTLLNAGADKVSINTAAIFNPELIHEAAERFGNQCIVVAIDAKRIQGERWEIFSHGGHKSTGINAIEWSCKMVAYGAGELLLTSMDRDGTRTGFDLELTRTISNSVSVPVIASGGVGNLDHLVDGLTKGKAAAVLAASIFHFCDYSIQEAKCYIAQHFNTNF